MSKYDVTMVEYPAKRLIGMKVRSTMAKASVDCAAIWETFFPRMAELGAAASAGSFGVSVMLSAEEFDYWAAVEVSAVAPVPQGLGVMELPAGLYAKVVIPSLEKLTEAFTYIYGEWSQGQAEYACDETKPGFEWYPADWQPTAPLEIFAPVKKK